MEDNFVLQVQKFFISDNFSIASNARYAQVIFEEKLQMKIIHFRNKNMDIQFILEQTKVLMVIRAFNSVNW